MKVTIRACHQLPSLSMARLVGGERGLEKQVDSVSVLEWIDLRELQRQFFYPNEMVITSMYALKDSVEDQVKAIRYLHDCGEVGMILYYVGVILPAVDPRLVHIANELDFPLFVMPENVLSFRYSEAITEICHLIFKSREKQTDFVKPLLDSLESIPVRFRNPSTVLRLLSDRMKATLILCDPEFHEYLFATWPIYSLMDVRRLIDEYAANPKGSGSGITQCVSMKNSFRRDYILLIAPHEGSPVSLEDAEKAAQVLDLAGKIWKYEDNENLYAEYLSTLMNGEILRSAKLAKNLAVDHEVLSTLWVLMYEGGDLSYERKLFEIAAIIKALREALKERGVRSVASIMDNRIVALVDSRAYEPCELLSEVLSALAREDLVVAQMHKVHSAQEARRAYFEILENLESAKRVYPRAKFLTRAQLQPMKKLREALGNERRVEEELSILRPLLEKEKGMAELVETLQVFYLDCQCDVGRTALAMFLHPNTVKYRLAKVSKILGFSFQDFPQAAQIYTALSLLRLHVF